MASKLFDLSGKIAFVSGASRGIGESIVRLLAEHGAHVIVSSRKLDDCSAVAESIRENGGSAEAMACHVGNMDDIQAMPADKSKKPMNSTRKDPFLNICLEAFSKLG